MGSPRRARQTFQKAGPGEATNPSRGERARLHPAKCNPPGFRPFRRKRCGGGTEKGAGSAPANANPKERGSAKGTKALEGKP